jgi:hypothetical protein
MAHPKGKESVRVAAEKVYHRLPLRFTLSRLHTEVVIEVQRPYLYMDTSRRKLMELREEGIINFICVDKAKSLYQKQTI